jgi:hypothetical protein
MSRLIAPVRVLCHYEHQKRNEQGDQVSSGDAFASIADETFTGHLDHARTTTINSINTTS